MQAACWVLYFGTPQKIWKAKSTSKIVMSTTDFAKPWFMTIRGVFRYSPNSHYLILFYGIPPIKRPIKGFINPGLTLVVTYFSIRGYKKHQNARITWFNGGLMEVFDGIWWDLIIRGSRIGVETVGASSKHWIQSSSNYPKKCK